MNQVGSAICSAPSTCATPRVATMRMRRGAVKKRRTTVASMRNPVASAAARPRPRAAKYGTSEAGDCDGHDRGREPADLGLGEVDDARRAVDEHEAERGERVERADDDAEQDHAERRAVGQHRAGHHPCDEHAAATDASWTASADPVSDGPIVGATSTTRRKQDDDGELRRSATTRTRSSAEAVQAGRSRGRRRRSGTTAAVAAADRAGLAVEVAASSRVVPAELELRRGLKTPGPKVHGPKSPAAVLGRENQPCWNVAG